MITNKTIKALAMFSLEQRVSGEAANKTGAVFTALKSQGPKGLTQLHYSEFCLRTAGFGRYFTRIARVVHELRHLHGVKIETIKEGKTGHARYVFVEGNYKTRGIK